MAEIWSIPTWLFLHTMAEKINEDFLVRHKVQVVQIVKLICGNLPCPYCREHATKYCRSLKPENIRKKQDLIDYLFVFHNSVNARLRKPRFSQSQLEKYKRGRIDVIWSRFYYGFMKKYSRTLYAGNLSQDAKRRRAGRFIHSWVKQNWKSLQG